MHYFGLNNRTLRKTTINRVYDFIEDNEYRLVQVDNLILDKITLRKPISLNCAHCNRVYGCCDGSPFKLNNEQNAEIESILDDLILTAKENNWAGYKDLSENRSTIIENNIIKQLKDLKGKNYCIMMQKINHNTYGCALQQYAMHKNKNPFTYKPISCVLFPLDIYVMDNRKLFIFAKNIDKHDTINGITKYKYTATNEPCLLGINYGFRDTKPVYEEYEDVLIYYFGIIIYKKIMRALKV
jgi:hypothetical protein